MVIREIRRFLRRGYPAAIVAGTVLTIGFSGAAITLDMVRALTRPQAGLQNRAFATIAEQTSAGGLARIDWYAIEALQSGVHLPDASMVAYAPPARHRLQWHGRSAQISIAFTESGFFSKFARSLYAGRDFTAGPGSGGGAGEAIVSEEFGRRFFGSAAGALHQDIRISSQRFTVVGIAPKGFEGLWSATDAWTTPDRWASMASEFQTDSPVSWKVAGIWYYLASADAGNGHDPALTLSAQLRDGQNRSLHLQAVPGLTDDPVRDRNVRTSSQLGFVVAMALLLSASLNYCILLFARSYVCVEEFRLKRVLGARARRLALDAVSGPLFVVFASFCVSGAATVSIQRFIATKAMNPPVVSGLGIGSAVGMLALEFPLACLLGVAIAAVPAVSLLRRSGAPQMGSTTTQTRRERFLLNCIVALEIAVCTLVCLFAGSFVRQYYLLSQVNLGFDPHRLTSYEASLKGSGSITISTSSGEDSPLAAFVRLSMMEAREKLSGLQSIAAASCTPFGPPMKTIDVYRFQPGSEPLKAISFCTVSQNLFSTVGTRIEQGVGFTEADYHGDVNRVVISRSLAKELWPQQGAIDRTLRLDMPASNLQMDVRVVGIAEDTREEGALSSPQPTVYLPLTGNATIMSFPLYFLARGRQSSEKFSEIVQRQSESTVQHLGIVRSDSVEEMNRRSWQEQNLRLKLALFGAIVVAFIAYAGLYGVLAHSVQVRQKELALRLTFGASTWSLQRAAVAHVLLGCFAAIFFALLMWRACFGLFDPRWMSGASWSWASAGAASLLCGLAAVAISLIPARRAIRLSPATLLRNE